MKNNCQICFPKKDEILKTNEIAVDLFGTEEDDSQVDPTLKTALDLISLEKYNFICLKEGDNVIAWSVVLPTSKETMKKFLKKEINEKDLFGIHLKNPSFEALYLSAVIVLPKYRKNGLGSFLMKEQIKYFQEKYGINDFYATTLSKEGKKLIESIERDLNLRIGNVSRI